MLYQLIKNFRRGQGESLYVTMFLSFVELHTVKNGKLFIIMRGYTSPSITVPMVGGQVGTNVQYVSYPRRAVFYSLDTCTGSLRQQQPKFLFMQKKITRM